MNHCIIQGPKLKKDSVSFIKFHSKESNAFSKSRSNTIPGIFSSSVLSIRSHISLEHSPIYLSLTKPNCVSLIILSRWVLILFAIHADASL